MIAIETFDSLVDAIYEAGLDPQQWPGALAELAAAAGANVADLLLHDSSRGASVRFSPGMDPAAVDAYEEHYCRLDPIRPAVERKPPGTIITDRDIVSKDWLTRTEFYNDWVRPQNFYDCTMLTLFRDPMRAGVICLAAPERADAFVARSSQLLGQWRPHLARAARITLKLAELDALRQAGFAALDRLTEGVVLADVKARVVFANGAAEAMFARADGVRVDASGLCAASSGQTMALRRLIALSASLENPHEAGGSLLLERPSGRRPLLPVAIIFVADPEQDGAPLEARLRALYGMTRAEATVAGLISKGSGVKGAARTLGIAPSTARTHLHRVFEKTGTRRQAELASLINKFSLARSY
jgi:DNA-binding CsgD family transcriptional regulator